MFSFVKFILFCCIICQAFSDQQHTREKIVSLRASSKESFNILKCFLDTKDFDVWDEQKSIFYVEVRVPWRKLFVLKRFCRRKSIYFKVIVEDLNHEIKENERSNEEVPHNVFNYERYNRYADIMKEVHRLKNIYPSHVRVCRVGHSWEGRPLLIVKVSENVISCQRDMKPILWIDSGVHAREWISPATGMFILREILIGSNNNSKVQGLLRNNTFYFIPVFNPDGYEYTFTTDRLWRKTRTRYVDSECVGADVNRNWNIMWGGSGSSSDPCSPLYHGIEAESEPCVHTYATILRQKKKLLKAYFSLHSYGQYLFVPNSYTLRTPTDINDIVTFAGAFIGSIKKRHNKLYLPVSAVFRFGPLTGVSLDYVHDKLNVTHSYVIELRDKGTSKFLLPPDQIRPTGEEVFDGLIAGILAI